MNLSIFIRWPVLLYVNSKCMQIKAHHLCAVIVHINYIYRRYGVIYTGRPKTKYRVRAI